MGGVRGGDLQTHCAQLLPSSTRLPEAIRRELSYPCALQDWRLHPFPPFQEKQLCPGILDIYRLGQRSLFLFPVSISTPHPQFSSGEPSYYASQSMWNYWYQPELRRCACNSSLTDWTTPFSQPEWWSSDMGQGPNQNQCDGIFGHLQGLLKDLLSFSTHLEVPGMQA